MNVNADPDLRLRPVLALHNNTILTFTECRVKKRGWFDEVRSYPYKPVLSPRVGFLYEGNERLDAASQSAELVSVSIKKIFMRSLVTYRESCLHKPKLEIMRGCIFFLCKG